MPVIKPVMLEKMCADIFQGAGLSNEEARRIAHSLVLSNLMGHDSHGVIRLSQYIQRLKEGDIKAGQSIQKVRESDASAAGDSAKPCADRLWNWPWKKPRPGRLQP